MPGVTGFLVDEDRPSDFADAMDAARRHPFDPAAIRAHAERFGVDRFEAGFRQILTDALAGAAAC